MSLPQKRHTRKAGTVDRARRAPWTSPPDPDPSRRFKIVPRDDDAQPAATAAPATEPEPHENQADPSRKLGYQFLAVPTEIVDAVRARTLKRIDQAVVEVLISYWLDARESIPACDSCWASKSTIAEALDVTPKSVQTSLRRLEDAGWIRQVQVGPEDPLDPRNRTGWRIVLLWLADQGRDLGPGPDRRPPLDRRKKISSPPSTTKEISSGGRKNSSSNLRSFSGGEETLNVFAPRVEDQSREADGTASAVRTSPPIKAPRPQALPPIQAAPPAARAAVGETPAELISALPGRKDLVDDAIKAIVIELRDQGSDGGYGKIFWPIARRDPDAVPVVCVLAALKTAQAKRDTGCRKPGAIFMKALTKEQAKLVADERRRADEEAERERRLRKRAAQVEAQAKAKAEEDARFQADQAQWAALSDAERTTILAAVLASNPYMVGTYKRNPEDPWVLATCFEAMRARGEASGEQAAPPANPPSPPAKASRSDPPAHQASPVRAARHYPRRRSPSTTPLALQAGST